MYICNPSAAIAAPHSPSVGCRTYFTLMKFCMFVLTIIQKVFISFYRGEQVGLCVVVHDLIVELLEERTVGAIHSGGTHASTYSTPRHIHGIMMSRSTNTGQLNG